MNKHSEKCPVCNGNGLVSAGFYSRGGDYPYWTTSNTVAEKCLSCDGKGWIDVLIRRIVSPELLPPGESDAEAEAKLHEGMVSGFTHWSSLGEGVVALTYDPDCPRCWEVRNRRKSHCAATFVCESNQEKAKP